MAATDVNGTDRYTYAWGRQDPAPLRHAKLL
jgi:hypothetical protein